MAEYRLAAADAPVFPAVDLDEVRAAIGGPVPETATPASDVIDQLIAGVEPAVIATTGPRYFGFVIGGALAAPTAAEMLVAAWDQNAYNYLSSPSSAVVEEIAGDWLKDLLSLPADVSVGFVTGAQAANTVCLAAARHKVLAEELAGTASSGTASPVPRQSGWSPTANGTPPSTVHCVSWASAPMSSNRSLRMPTAPLRSGRWPPRWRRGRPVPPSCASRPAT